MLKNNPGLLQLGQNPPFSSSQPESTVNAAQNLYRTKNQSSKRKPEPVHKFPTQKGTI